MPASAPHRRSSKRGTAAATVVVAAVLAAALSHANVGSAQPVSEECAWRPISAVGRGRFSGSAVVVDETDHLGGEDLYVFGGLDVPSDPRARLELVAQVDRIRLPGTRIPAATVPPEPVGASLTRHGHTSEVFAGDDDRQRIVIIGGNDAAPPTATATRTPTRTPTATATRGPGESTVAVTAIEASIEASPAHVDGRPAAPLRRAASVGPLVEYVSGAQDFDVGLGAISPAVQDHASVLITDSVSADVHVLLDGGRTGDDSQKADGGGTRLLTRREGAWTSLVLASPGPARLGHTMVWDPLARRVILFGGTQDRALRPSNDVYEMRVPDPLNSAPLEWQTLFVRQGIEPDGRAFHSAVYDTKKRRMIVFGGEGPIGSASHMNDTWALEFDGTAPHWRPLTMDPRYPVPSARSSAAMAYDDDRGWPMLIGGVRLDNLGQPVGAFRDVYALVCRDPNAPPEPTDTPTPTPTITPTRTPTPTGTLPPTHTPTPTVTPTATASPTRTSTPTTTSSPTPPRVSLPVGFVCRAAYCTCMHLESEPNTTSALATAQAPLCEDEWVDGWRMSGSDEQDVYWLKVKSHGLLKVWLEDLAPGLDLDLYLYLGDEEDPRYRDHPLQSSENRGPVSEDVGTSAVGGRTYVVLVKPFAGTSDQPYRLRWTLDPNWPLRAAGGLAR